MATGTLSRPDRFNFATDVVDDWAARSPTQDALYWVSQDLSVQKTFTFHQISRQSHRLAVLLNDLGLATGDVVVLVLPRVPAWWEVATAALRAGIIIAPATTLLTADDIAYRCQVSRARAFVGDAVSVAKALSVQQQCPTLQTILQADGPINNSAIDLYARLANVSESAIHASVKQPWNTPSIFYFTSGTSGPPKMVQHNQISYPLAHRSTAEHWYRLKSGKLLWNSTEQGWGKAAYSFFGAWNVGAGLFVWDDRGSFNPLKILDLLHRYPITAFCAPPLAWRQLVQPQYQRQFQRRRPKALESCHAAGESLAAAVLEDWRLLSGLSIHEGYGQTETTLTCGIYGDLEVRPGSMGKPLPGVPLHIIDSEGNDAADNTEGDIALLLADGSGSESGPFFGVFDGYLDQHGKLTRKVKTTTIHGRKKDWYLTGDRAARDKDGYYWFVGRGDDVINTAGYRIGPYEVESTLLKHPAVSEAAVVSSPDTERGEVVKAFIVLSPSYKGTDHTKLVSELQNFCKSKAAPYKYPRKVEVVSSLEKTISGKVKRAELRKAEWQRATVSSRAKL